MIDSTELLKDLKNLLPNLENDIRDRSGDDETIGEHLQSQYKAAKDAERTSATFTEWRDDQVTQAAVAWILGCVFIRFIEDNGLIKEAWIAGPGDRLAQSRDQHTHYLSQHPRETDRD